MFDSLNDQMKQDEKGEKTLKERVYEWLAIIVLSVVVFGGLFLGVRLLS
jgi:hypothetical protein